VQKSVPVKLARLLVCISIICCFDSHPRIDSVLQKYGFSYGLLENAIVSSDDNLKKLLSSYILRPVLEALASPYPAQSLDKSSVLRLS
jgi:hypothetical protein